MSARSVILLAALTGLLAGGAEGAGQNDKTQHAKGIDTPLVAGQPDPANGRRIVVDRRKGLCLLCHSGPFPEERFQGTLAPSLAGAGARLSQGEMRLRIVDSRKVNPESLMPAYFRADGLNEVGAAWKGRTILSASEVEDVVAFLMTLKE